MTPAGLARLKADEGCKLSSYPDPLSPLAKTGKGSGAPWTIGYGATGDGIGPGTVWSKLKADADIEARVAAIEKDLKARLPWFALMPAVRRDVLVNIGYNVGVPSLMSWKTTIGYFAASAWQHAADCLRNEGAWNRQVGLRAERLAVATETGSWA